MRAPRPSLLAVALTLGCFSGAGCTSPRPSGTSTGGLGPTSTGSSGSTSTGSSSTTGGMPGDAGPIADAGCDHPGQVSELGKCVLSVDCKCPLICAADPQGNLACQLPCAGDAGCAVGESCIESVCQLSPACNLLGGAGEFEGCTAVSDCACPLSCFADPQIGESCELACTTDADCLDAGEFCESDAGSCQRVTTTCDPNPNAAGEFQQCAGIKDCRCPLACFADPFLGSVCEFSCQGDGDCPDAGESCTSGSCQPRVSCSSVLSPDPFVGCTSNQDCACPLFCILVPGTQRGFCELCDGGSCEPPGGSCTDAGSEAAGWQTFLPAAAGSPTATGCQSNTVCDCPNQCLPIPGDSQFFCQPPAPSCAGLSDCPDPTEACLFGHCLPNGCAVAAKVGDACDVANGLDVPPVTKDGVCLPSPRGLPVLVCTQGGDGGPGCDPGGTRARPETLCPGGSVCLAGDGGALCAPVCVAGGKPGCASSSNCVGLNAAEVVACPDCIPLQGCLTGDVTCTNDLPIYSPADGPFDSSGFGGEMAPCTGSDCLCPLSCVFDFALSKISFSSGGTFCERACQGDADCPWPQTSCSGGSCAITAGACTAGVLGGAPSNLGSACDTGTGTGTCVYFSPFEDQWDSSAAGYSEITAPLATCRANGTAQSACDPAAQRASSGLCGAGADCFPFADGGDVCQALCDPEADAGACGSGRACVPMTRNIGGVDEGACLTLADGGCPAGLPSNELASCLGDADCACGLGCFQDPALSAPNTPVANFCERPCSVASDCALDQFCYDDRGQLSCRLNLCSLGGALLTASAICGADSQFDGTCLVESPAMLAPSFLPREPTAIQGLSDVCLKAGTATSACDPSAGRGQLAELCVPGAFCDSSGSTPLCTPLCFFDPSVPSPCAPGQLCVPLPSYLSPDNGLQFSELDALVEGECLPAIGVDAGQ